MNASDFVTLKNGLTLPIAALQLAWALEDRGHHFSIDGDVLSVGPGDCLTDDDRALIRRWKPHLLALVRYCETVQ